MRRSSYKGEHTTKLYTINSSLAKFIEASISPKKKNEYDLKVAEFMVNTLKELLSASEEKLGLIAVYEQNLWSALSRLEEKTISLTGGSLMSTTLSGGFTMMTQIVKKDDKKKILRTQTLLPFTTFQKIQKRNSSKLIPEADVEKDLLDLCFTG